MESGDSAQIELLRDALDHIIRVAATARVPTRRLDWIIARARAALRGRRWTREDLPRPNRYTDERIKELRQAIKEIVVAYESGDAAALARAIDGATTLLPSRSAVKDGEVDQCET